MRLKIGFVVAMMAGLSLVLSPTVQSKEKPPKPLKMKKLSFPSFKEFKTRNGIEAVVVEHHEQPVVSIVVVIKSGGVLDPDGLESLADFVVNLINKGTKDKDSNELAKWIESVGGTVSLNSGDDFTTISVSVLSEYIDTAYEYLQDILLNPTFPEDELEEYRKRVKTSLELELSQPSAVASRHFREVVYGEHPYAKQPTGESVEAITRDDIVDFYKKNYVANNALIAVVGDVKWKNVKKDLKKYFGSWQKGEAPVAQYGTPPEITGKTIYLYHKPGAVQTNILVGHPGLEPTNPDWPAVTTANRVLGGGADARLFMDLREKRGWTYGAYSRFSKVKDIGYFQASVAVRTEVTDSALVELMKELKRITEEKVTAEELDHAKSYLVGNFPTTIETPNQIASQIVRVKLLGLGKEYLEEYRKRISRVTVDDVMAAMKKYLHPDDADIVLVGDATRIYDKIKDIAPVKLFDLEGNPISMAELSVTPVSYSYDTSGLKDMQATYALSVPQMALGDLVVDLKRVESDGVEIIRVVSTISGMISLDETLEFKAADLTPISVKSSMKTGPMATEKDLKCERGRMTGKIKGMKDEQARDVNKDIVDGTIFDDEMEYALASLPLEVGKKYKFPVFDSSGGNLNNVDVEIMGEEEVSVPAGSFKVFKIKVKGTRGEMYLYSMKDSPHIMVKQEMPAQGFKVELKKLAR